MPFPFFGKRSKAATVEKKITSVEKIASPVEKITSPAEKTTSPAEKTTAPVAKITSPVGKTTSPVEKKIATVEKKTPAVAKKPPPVVKDGVPLRWPRIGIMIIGILLICLCFIIVGMEVGNTVSDLYRATAFGGFIAFPFLLACAILVLITAFLPRLILRRIATILCVVMIILCLALVTYDVIIVVDPTRCFFYNCNTAPVSTSNATSSFNVYGWPLSIVWPTAFQLNMNNKRIFQSIQMCCALLYISLASAYILTYFIYHIVRLPKKKEIDHADQRSIFTRDTTGNSNDAFQSQYNTNFLIKSYTIDGRPAVVPKTTPRKTKRKTNFRPRASSVNTDRICSRCHKNPRVGLKTDNARQNYFSHLCVTCNNEILSYNLKPSTTEPIKNRVWKA